MITFPPALAPAGVAAPAPLATPAPPNSTATVVPPAIPPVESAAVELSRLGLFLSSLAQARRRLAELRTPVPSNTDAQRGATGSADVAALSQNLADAFNSLRAASIDTARTPADTLLEQQLRGTLARPGQDSATAFFTLDQADQTDAAALRVDLQALQAAIEADPDATLARLERTTQEFDELSAALTQRRVEADATAEAIENEEIEAREAAERIERERSAGLAAEARTEVRRENEDDVQAEAATAQKTLADMALADLLGESQMQTAPAQARAETGTETGTDAGAAAVPAAPLADADRADLLARDPSVAAALAAYYVNQGPFRTASSDNQGLAPAARTPAVAPVQAVTPVAAVPAIGDAGTDTKTENRGQV